VCVGVCVCVCVCVFVCVIRHPHCCGYQREIMCGLLSCADVNTLRQWSMVYFWHGMTGSDAAVSVCPVTLDA